MPHTLLLLIPFGAPFVAAMLAGMWLFEIAERRARTGSTRSAGAH